MLFLIVSLCCLFVLVCRTHPSKWTTRALWYVQMSTRMISFRIYWSGCSESIQSVQNCVCTYGGVYKSENRKHASVYNYIISITVWHEETDLNFKMIWNLVCLSSALMTAGLMLHYLHKFEYLSILYCKGSKNIWPSVQKSLEWCH